MSMAGYTKLFSSMIHSTVWREADHVRIVWVTLMAMADLNGEIEASVPGLADAARVTVENCQDALRRLSAVDPYSRSKEHEGRRIESIDGGWVILNYAKYREKLSAAHTKEKTAERVRRWRARQKCNEKSNTRNSKCNVGNYTQKQTQTQTEIQNKKTTTTAAKIPCPPDLALHPNQVATLTVGGVPEWAIKPLMADFLSTATGDPDDLRTLAVWRKCAAKAIRGNWNNPNTRPKRDTANSGYGGGYT